MLVHSIQTLINIEENENKNNLVTGLYDSRSERYIREMMYNECDGEGRYRDWLCKIYPVKNGVYWHYLFYLSC